MLHIFFNTLPFFALIALGYVAAKRSIFSQEATAHLTKFVFYFALSAMLFKFSSNLALSDILEWDFMAAYLIGSLSLYVLTAMVARFRGQSFESAVIEAQCSVIGNMGWMGLAMLPILLGEQAISYVIMVLIIDLMIFGPLIVILLVAHREGQLNLKLLQLQYSGVSKPYSKEKLELLSLILETRTLLRVNLVKIQCVLRQNMHQRRLTANQMKFL